MKPIKIVIIDYGMGNIRSIYNAFVRLGCEVTNSDNIADLKKADALILPGVGAFGEAVERMTSCNLSESLIRLVRDEGMPILGICLGMQLLADSSNERGSYKGLGLIPGEVRKIEVPSSLRLPHVGWNSIQIEKQEALFRKIPEGSAFYFVHSYHFVCENDEHIVATTDYGNDVVATVQNGRVYGVQFHPERSQAYGLALLENFISEVRNLRQGAMAC